MTNIVTASREKLFDQQAIDKELDFIKNTIDTRYSNECSSNTRRTMQNLAEIAFLRGVLFGASNSK